MFERPDKIFNSSDFTSFLEKLLITLIQNGNLKMSIIQVWKHTLKWGIAQNPELPSDLTNFPKEDFNSLKDSLKRCLPFIKFYYFLNFVIPYMEILPEKLYINLLIRSLASDCNPTERPEPMEAKEVKYTHMDHLLQ